MPEFSPNGAWNIMFYLCAISMFAQILIATPVVHFCVMKPLDKIYRPDWQPVGVPGEGLWKAAGYIFLVTACAIEKKKFGGLLGRWAKSKTNYFAHTLGIDHDIRVNMNRFQIWLCYFSCVNSVFFLTLLPLTIIHDFVIFPGIRDTQ